MVSAILVFMAPFMLTLGSYFMYHQSLAMKEFYRISNELSSIEHPCFKLEGSLICQDTGDNDIKAFYIYVLNGAILLYLITFVSLPALNYFIVQAAKTKNEIRQLNLTRAKQAYNFGILLPQGLALCVGYYLVFYGQAKSHETDLFRQTGFMFKKQFNFVLFFYFFFLLAGYCFGRHSD